MLWSLFILLKRKEKKNGSFPRHSLVLQRGIAVFLTLSGGNTSSTTRSATAVGGECPVLDGTHGVTLRVLDVFIPHMQLTKGALGIRLVCNGFPSSLSCILCSQSVLCFLPLAIKCFFAAA